MEDLKENHTTLMEASVVKYNKELDDEKFSLRNLESN